MNGVTTDYSTFRDEFINKRIGAFYDFCGRKNADHASRVDKHIEKLFKELGESFGLDVKNMRAADIVSSGASKDVFTALGADKKGVDIEVDLYGSFDAVLAMQIVKMYLSSNYRLKKNTFQQAADYMTSRLKNDSFEFSATNATDKLHKKKGSSFMRSFDSGQFTIDGVRYGPRDGIILQLSKGGEFYELAAQSVPPLDDYFYKKHGIKAEINPLQNEIFYALVEGLTQRCGVTFVDTMDAIEMVLDDPKLPIFGTSGEKEELISREEKSKEKTKDIRKEIPNFGMWG